MAAVSPLPREGELRVAGVRRAGEVAAQPRGTVPSGYPQLDSVLPGGGWPRGALVELQLASAGIGELQLLAGALVWQEHAARVAFLDPPAEPGLAALSRAGLAPRVITVARSPSDRDRRWAAEQILRSGGFTAALLWWPTPLDDRTARRLNVALGAGGGLGFVFSPPANVANGAVLRLGLRGGGPGVLLVDVLKRRGAPVAPMRMEWPHALGCLPISFTGA